MGILSVADLQAAGFVEAWLEKYAVTDSRCKAVRRELRASFQEHLVNNEGTYAEAVSAQTFYRYLERVSGFRPSYIYGKLGYRGLALAGTDEAARCTFVPEPTETERLFNMLTLWLEPCDDCPPIRAMELRHRFMVWHGIDNLGPVQFGKAMAEFIAEVGGAKERKIDGIYYVGVRRSAEAPGPAMTTLPRSSVA